MKHIAYHIYSKVKCTRNINIEANPNKGYDNDMHVSLLDPKYLSPFWQHKKETKGDLYEIKAGKVEVEIKSVGKPSSPHADSHGDSQCAQSSVGDAQT